MTAGGRAGDGSAPFFFTGFPGFLGSDLLVRLLRDRPEATAHCLLLPRHRALARERLRRPPLAAAGDRVVLHAGDVTRPDLELSPGIRSELAAEVVEIFHLAAAYDLGIDAETATRVNRDGTEHVLDLAADCGRLRRFHQMSTCYVSGRRSGAVREEDLDEGQSFHNPYERSKMEAEVLVRERMAGGLPATVYRPSIVVGDSDTGRTQKYDGPYHVLRWILRQPRWAVVPVPPGADRITVNQVPRDFVTRAVTHLSRSPDAVGETVHLADPVPPTAREVVDGLAGAAGRRAVAVPVPPALLRVALERVPGLSRVTGIPPALADYFDHPARYSTERARALLSGSGVVPPRFEDYVEAMVAFVRENPEPTAGVLA